MYKKKLFTHENKLKNKRIEEWLTQCVTLWEQPVQTLNEEQNEDSSICSSIEEQLSNPSSKPSSRSILDLDIIKDMDTKDFKGMTVEDVIELREVLSKNVLGMSLDEFQSTYYRVHGRQLSKYHFGSIAEMLHNLNKVFTLETIEDPEEDRLPEDDIFGKLIYDARLQFLPIVEKTVKRIKLEEKSIPESEQIFWFNLIRSEVTDIHINRYSVEWRYFGFNSRIQFFERLSQLIPIFVDKERKVLKMKPLSALQEFISQLMTKRNRHFLQMLEIPGKPDLVVDPGLQIDREDIEDVFHRIKYKTKAVYISSVISSEKFYGVLIEEDFLKLWENIEETYRRDDSIEYEVPKEFVVSGLVCAVKCKQNGWIRAQVIKTPDFETDVKIRCKSIDFGYELSVKYSRLRLLKKEFSHLSARSLQFHLNGVQNAKRFRGSVFKFRNKRKEVTNDELFCQFVGIRDQSLDVIVFETDDLTYYYSIAIYLIEHNWAEKTDDYVIPDWEQLFQTVQQYYKH